MNDNSPTMKRGQSGTVEDLVSSPPTHPHDLNLAWVTLTLASGRPIDAVTWPLTFWLFQEMSTLTTTKELANYVMNRYMVLIGYFLTCGKICQNPIWPQAVNQKSLYYLIMHCMQHSKRKTKLKAVIYDCCKRISI